MHDPAEMGAGEMSDHDPMCRGTRKEWNGPREYRHVCDCDLIARVRADEAECPSQSTIRRVADRAFRDGYAHAEAVAAKLVEVIVQDDLWRELLEAKLDRISLMWRAACKERDAARAEVAALRKQEWAAPYRREVLADLRAAFQQGGGTKEQAALYSIPYQRALADLRAKVESLPDESHMADSPGLIWRSEVLALIEEARP